MKRALIVLALLMVVFAESADTQSRRRPGRRRPFIPVASHTVTIVTPTTLTEFPAAEAAMEMTGAASGVNADHVEWSNDRGGSGVATGVGTWSVAASAGTTTVFSDAMNCATVTALASQVPQIGTGYTEVVDTAGTVTLNCTPVGYGYADSSPAAGNVVINTLTPSPALSGTDFEFSATLTAGGSSNKRWGLVYRYSDANNYCAVVVRHGQYSPDLYWVKKVAGVFSDLHAAMNAGQTVGDQIKLVRTGSSVELFVAGVSKGTSSDAFCDDNVTLGVGAGALGGVGTDTMGTDARFDNVMVVDPAGGASGIVLQTGVNVITVTLKDAADVTLATDTLTVTYAAADTTSPSASIDTPTNNPTDSTSTAAQTIAGTAIDNLAVTSVTWACPQCSGTSGTATGTDNWSFNVTLGCSAAPGTNNVITVTPHDLAGNTPVTDVLTFNCTSGDSTDPVPVISTNGGGGAGVSFSQAGSTVLISGTATDVGVGLSRIDLECSTCSPATVIATGTDQWSGTMTLSDGANVITARAYDLAGNDGTDTITVTKTVALSVITSSPLSSVTEDVAMVSKVINATGGTLPYTWSIDGSPTSVNDGDAQCAGIGYADSGDTMVISGTPTTVGVCDFTVKVTDASGGSCPGSACATKAMQITVVVAGSGGFDFFNTNIQRPDHWKSISFNPTVGVNCTDTYMGVSFAGGDRTLGTCNPYFADQLNDTGTAAQRYFYPPTVADSSGVATPSVAYDAVGGGAVLELPNYTSPISAPTLLVDNVPSGAPTGGAVCAAGAPANCIIIKNSRVLGSNWSNRTARIDNELFHCSKQVGFNPALPTTETCWRPVSGGEEVRLIRASFGTTAAAHTAGAIVAIHTAGGTQQLRVPIKSTDGHTYLVMIDIKFNEAWVKSGIGNGGNKFGMLSSVGGGDERLFETKYQYTGASAAPGLTCSNNGVSWDPDTMIASLDARSYNGIASGPNIPWTDTNGNTLGDNVTLVDLLKPQLASMCILPNKWMRWWFFIDQRANDYDLISWWAADEGSTPVKMFDALEFSVRPDQGAMTCVTSSGCKLDKLWVHQNDTYETHMFGTTDQFRLRKLWFRGFQVLRDVDPSELTTPGAGLLLKPLP